MASLSLKYIALLPFAVLYCIISAKNSGNSIVKTIAYIKTDYDEKFGIPRQSGLVQNTEGRIVFLPEYRRAEAVRGLEGYSHIWLIWEFSESKLDDWRPTVRPPRLGGNRRMGVFATRSPFRPNPIGLSSVRLLRIETDLPESPVLVVSGADLLNGTPIYDIKPYLPYVDCHPDAVGGFADKAPEAALRVVENDCALRDFPEDKREALYSILQQDPRPSYQNDPERLYGFGFAGYEIKFRVAGDLITVISAEKREG